MTPAKGQIWKEVDPRITREVEIVDVDLHHVRIRSGTRVTQAKKSRFNGKRGGYAFVRWAREVATESD